MAIETKTSLEISNSWDRTVAGTSNIWPDFAEVDYEGLDPNATDADSQSHRWPLTNHPTMKFLWDFSKNLTSEECFAYPQYPWEANTAPRLVDDRALLILSRK